MKIYLTDKKKKKTENVISIVYDTTVNSRSKTHCLPENAISFAQEYSQ